jgi:hypothetical protein
MFAFPCKMNAISNNNYWSQVLQGKVSKHCHGILEAFLKSSIFIFQIIKRIF